MTGVRVAWVGEVESDIWSGSGRFRLWKERVIDATLSWSWSVNVVSMMLLVWIVKRGRCCCALCGSFEMIRLRCAHRWSKLALVDEKLYSSWNLQKNAVSYVLVRLFSGENILDQFWSDAGIAIDLLMLLHKFVQSEVQLSGSLAGVGECILL